MASDLDNLTQLKSNLIQLLANETTYQLTHGKPKPNYTIDGQSVSWDDWQSKMMERIDKIDALIQRAGGPFEIRTQGIG